MGWVSEWKYLYVQESSLWHQNIRYKNIWVACKFMYRVGVKLVSQMFPRGRCVSQCSEPMTYSEALWTYHGVLWTYHGVLWTCVHSAGPGAGVTDRVGQGTVWWDGWLHHQWGRTPPDCRGSPRPAGWPHRWGRGSVVMSGRRTSHQHGEGGACRGGGTGIEGRLSLC